MNKESTSYLHKFITKIYFTIVLLIFKSHKLPKCISRFIIMGFFDHSPAILFSFEPILNCSAILRKNLKKTDKYAYTNYYEHYKYYSKYFACNDLSLITDFKNIYIDEKFTADYNYNVYKIIPQISSNYMTSMVSLLIKIFKFYSTSDCILCVPKFYNFNEKIIIYILNNYLDQIAELLSKSIELMKKLSIIKKEKEKTKNLKEYISSF